MDWRKPTVGEACEIALVVFVLTSGVVLLMGLPSISVRGGRTAHADWACAVEPVDHSTCARRADAPPLEGRAVRKDFTSTPH